MTTAPRLHAEASAEIEAQYPHPALYKEALDTLYAIDLSSSKVSMAKSSGGTSAYAIVSENGATKGAIITENSATKIDGEAAAYSLARLLGYAHTVQPAKIRALSGSSLIAFRNFLSSNSWSGDAASNKAKILQNIANKPNGPIYSVAKAFFEKPYAVDELVNPRGVSNGTFVTSSEYAKWIRQDGPQPGESTVTRNVKGVSSTQTQKTLAKELSTHFLIDACLGQWDRFSGGNLQVLSRNGALHFALFDNGGTWGSSTYVDETLSFVSRFDRSVSDKIIALGKFVQGTDASFEAFSDLSELRSFLQLELSEDRWNTFKKNTIKTGNYIEQVSENGKYFQ